MNNPQIPDSSIRNSSISLPSATALANLRQTSREMAQFNRELAEIEAQLDRELYAQKLARMDKKMQPQP